MPGSGLRLPYPSIDWVLAASENPEIVGPIWPPSRTVDYRYTRPAKHSLPAARPAGQTELASHQVTTDNCNARHQPTAEPRLVIPKIVIQDWDDIRAKVDASTAESTIAVMSGKMSTRVARGHMKAVVKRICALFVGRRVASMRRLKTIEQVESDLHFDLLN
ncbi:hypothetical protein FA95DRAFT_1605168 [Auriscalpium vulgare]|uniref:Uncharacterized protein n=1 Tax=Auriscalpium vulgare TaxID=40419 RepID=A0ACB8RXB0_9AGAM|nr:hypothetical protein FA95DRAFT_1605168 [Auriscalpium vulgare]